MRTVYDLEIKLQSDPEQVRDAQALTLDESRPLMGLAGTYGLFGSDEWWGNLKSAALPATVYEGRIESLQFEGMHNEGRSFTLRLENGGSYTYSCVANERADLKAYATGRRARVTTFAEPKKNGELLEMVWRIELEDA